jgi:hypothetical protein
MGKWFANRGQVVQVINSIFPALAAIAVRSFMTNLKVVSILLVIVTCGWAAFSVTMFFRNRAQEAETATAVETTAAVPRTTRPTTATRSERGGNMPRFRIGKRRSKRTKSVVPVRLWIAGSKDSHLAQFRVTWIVAREGSSEKQIGAECLEPGKAGLG